MRKIIIVSCLLWIYLFGCAKRIPVTYDQVGKNTLVRIRTHSNNCYNGIVKSKKPSFIVLQTARNAKSLRKIARDNIYNIHSNPPVYDYQNKVISEWEIQDKQGINNTVLYTVGGVGLSFGASFFIGSLAHRSLSDVEQRNSVLWATTGGGTALGTYFFVRTGRRKDREASILSIREHRYIIAKQEINKQKGKHQKVQHELKKLKADRKKQDDEMKRLIKRIKERQKNREEN